MSRYLYIYSFRSTCVHNIINSAQCRKLAQLEFGFSKIRMLSDYMGIQIFLDIFLYQQETKFFDRLKNINKIIKFGFFSYKTTS